MLDGIPFADLTAPTLLGLTVLFVLLGRIVPRSTLLEKIEEAKKWQQAYEVEREARQLAVAQTAELLEVARTTHAILQATFGSLERRQSGDAHVASTPPAN